MDQEFIYVALNRGVINREDLMQVSSCSYAHPPKVIDNREEDTELPKITRK